MSNLASQITGAPIAGNLWALAFWRRPRSYWTVVVYHLPLAITFGVALLLPYGVALNKLPLIPCTFRNITGYPCPFCGFTRSFWDIANGQWSAAMANCPLAFLVYLFVVIMAVWHITALISNVVISRGPMLQRKPTHRREIVVAVICLFTLNWIYRLGMGLI